MGITVLNVVLEEDGSEVEADYFEFLPENSILQLLSADEKWESAEGRWNKNVGKMFCVWVNERLQAFAFVKPDFSLHIPEASNM